MWTDITSTNECLNNKPQVKLLKSYASNETLESMNPDFYTHFGFRDWWRYPLVYPYSINAVDSLDYGYLVDESAVTSYMSSEHNELQLLYSIKRFTFDKNYMLIGRESDFILFSFDSGEMLGFDIEEKLFSEARGLGFEGRYEFMTLREYATLFSCEE